MSHFITITVCCEEYETKVFTEPIYIHTYKRIAANLKKLFQNISSSYFYNGKRLLSNWWKPQTGKKYQQRNKWLDCSVATTEANKDRYVRKGEQLGQFLQDTPSIKLKLKPTHITVVERGKMWQPCALDMLFGFPKSSVWSTVQPLLLLRTPSTCKIFIDVRRSTLSLRKCFASNFP